MESTLVEKTYTIQEASAEMNVSAHTHGLASQPKPRSAFSEFH